MYQDDFGKIYLEDDDQCLTCSHYTGGTACPLMEALYTGTVFLDKEVRVQNCGFYGKHKRRLEIVR